MLSESELSDKLVSCGYLDHGHHWLADGVVDYSVDKPEDWNIFHGWESQREWKKEEGDYVYLLTVGKLQEFGVEYWLMGLKGFRVFPGGSPLNPRVGFLGPTLVMEVMYILEEDLVNLGKFEKILMGGLAGQAEGML